MIRECLSQDTIVPADDVEPAGKQLIQEISIGC